MTPTSRAPCLPRRLRSPPPSLPPTPQEREFQNMFTFCRDFEAATLKLPPPQPSAIPPGTQQQPGMPNPAAAAAVAQAALTVLAGSKQALGDPSLLLQHHGGGPYYDPTLAGYDYDGTGVGGGSSTLGLGGFLPGGGGSSNGGGGGLSTGPPRRQSIGFAKFKTRQAALDARDALQGRKVDVERASVLKAEMAKKNLHTRRGVGGDDGAASPTVGAGVGVVGGGVAVGSVGSPPGGGGSGSMGPPPMPFRAAAGPGSTRPPAEPSSLGSTASSAQADWIGAVDQATPVGAGPRAAAADDDGGRESPPMLSASSLSSASPPSHLQSPTLEALPDGPFGQAGHLQAPHGSRKGDVHGSGADRAPSPEPFGFARSLAHHPAPDLRPLDDMSEFSPPLTPGGLGFNGETLTQAHYRSPSLGQQQPVVPPAHLQQRPPAPVEDGARDSDPGSASGSASSSFGKAGGDRLKHLPRTANPADMNPPVRLPLPTPGAVPSFPRECPADHPVSAPPPPPLRRQINTLYVGNLPTTPAPSSSNMQLEEALRVLFSRCDGFRRLSYRQKTNGPMCFVEVRPRCPLAPVAFHSGPAADLSSPLPSSSLVAPVRGRRRGRERAQDDVRRHGRRPRQGRHPAVVLQAPARPARAVEHANVVVGHRRRRRELVDEQLELDREPAHGEPDDWLARRLLVRRRPVGRLEPELDRPRRPPPRTPAHVVRLVLRLKRPRRRPVAAAAAPVVRRRGLAPVVPDARPEPTRLAAERAVLPAHREQDDGRRLPVVARGRRGPPPAVPQPEPAAGARPKRLVGLALVQPVRPRHPQRLMDPHPLAPGSCFPSCSLSLFRSPVLTASFEFRSSGTTTTIATTTTCTALSLRPRPAPPTRSTP